MGERKVYDVFIVFKFDLKDQCIVVKLSFLFKGRRSCLVNCWVTGHPLKAICSSILISLIKLLQICKIRIVTICFLYPVFLVTICTCSKSILLSALYLGLDKFEVVWSDAHPLCVLAHLRFVHYSLKELVASVARPSCDSRLSEVHQFEGVFSVLTCIPHSEVKPLLVTPCVCINLHV